MFAIVVDMFEIGVCRSRSAHIDGGNGFPIRLFAHVFASNTVIHVPFNVWHQCLCCCEQNEGDLIFSESRCFASEITVPIHIVIVVCNAVWPDVTFGLAAVAFIKPLKKYASWWCFKELTHGLPRRDRPAAPHMNRNRGLCAYETMMFIVGHVPGRHLPPQTKPQLPGAGRSECFGVFASVFFVAAMSALSVCPQRLPLTPALNVLPLFWHLQSSIFEHLSLLRACWLERSEPTLGCR